MKYLLPVITLIMFFNCHKNEFSNTEIHLKTNKDRYRINDTIQLKITIRPVQEATTIRFFKNFNNINVSFVSNQEQLGFHQELKKRFIEGPSPTQDESEYLDEYHITRAKPFEKTFTGTISKLEDKIIVEIPELHVKDSIDENYLLQDPTITIQGSCRTIYSIEEQPFAPIQIRYSAN